MAIAIRKEQWDLLTSRRPVRKGEPQALASSEPPARQASRVLKFREEQMTTIAPLLGFSTPPARPAGPAAASPPGGTTDG